MTENVKDCKDACCHEKALFHIIWRKCQHYFHSITGDKHTAKQRETSTKLIHMYALLLIAGETSHQCVQRNQEDRAGHSLQNVGDCSPDNFTRQGKIRHKERKRKNNTGRNRKVFQIKTAASFSGYCFVNNCPHHGIVDNIPDFCNQNNGGCNFTVNAADVCIEIQQIDTDADCQ